MKKTIERLWDEYLLEECATMDAEALALTGKTAELHAKVDALLNADQREALEKYAEALHETEALSAKKAFLRGCEFSVSFLLEAGKS